MTSPNSNEVEIRVVGHDSTGDTLDRARSRISTFLNWIRDAFSRAGKEAGEKLGDGLWRSADGRLRDAKGRFAAAAQDAASSAASAFVGMFGKMFSSFNLHSPLLLLVAAIFAAAAAFTAMAGAALIAAGAVGTLAAAGFGLTATVATLVLGFGGLGDALKAHGQQAGGAGRSSAAAAREVKAATEALADAQRAAARASEDVNRARADETERLEDLSRALTDAMLDEEGAALAVRRAQERLRDARRGGTALDRAEASLGLRQAEQSLKNVQDRVGDLKREKEEADAKGVEGSERVQSALERQMQAQRQLEDVTRRLADAHRGPAAGGVNKFAEAMAALSANGQAVVLTLLALKPQFDALKRSVQDRLLAGMDVTIKDLATKWLPALQVMLGGLADSFNSSFKGIAETISTPKFMADVGKILDQVGESSKRLGKGFESLLSALATLGRASIPFWEKLGELVGGMLDNFGAWIAKKDESGELGRFFDTAAAALEKAWTVGGKFFHVIGQIAAILFDDSKAAGKSFLDNVSEGLDGISEWLKNPENQEKIKEWVDRLMDVVGAILMVIGKLIELGMWIDDHRIKLSMFGDAWIALGRAIALAAKGLWDPIKEGFKAALNWIIDKWNGLSFKLPSVNFFGSQIGGGSLDTPNIPRLASGGIGGGLAQVAERGRELIRTPDGGMLLAMPQGSTVIPNGTTESMLGGRGPVDVRLTFDFKKAGMDSARRWLMEIVDVYGGGNVQAAIGKRS